MIRNSLFDIRYSLLAFPFEPGGAVSLMRLGRNLALPSFRKSLTGIMHRFLAVIYESLYWMIKNSQDGGMIIVYAHSRGRGFQLQAEPMGRRSGKKWIVDDLFQLIKNR